MGHLVTLFEALETVAAGGETSLAGVLNELAGRMSRRGLVILISDAFDHAGPLLESLQFLRHRKQDVRLFQVIHPDEENFPFEGMMEFLGLESEPRLKLDGSRVRVLYQETLAAHQRKLAEGCHALGIPRHLFRTDADLALNLLRALSDLATPPPRRQ